MSGVLLKEDCQTCGGSGIGGHDSVIALPCPVCAGRGWNPTDKAIETFTETYKQTYSEFTGEIDPDGNDELRAIEAGLIAVLSMGDTDG